MAPVSGRTFVFLIAFMAGCSLDFTVRPDPADGGSPQDGGPDANQPDGDSGGDVTVADAGDASSADVDAAVDCKGLADDVDAKLKAARTCVLASGQCTTTLKNQCDCDVVIASNGSTQASSYQDAVAKFKSSGCVLGCTGTCASTANRNCLQGGGGDTLCFPPP